MVVIDIGSMCCDCGYETFTVFGPRWSPGWDDFNCDAERPKACAPGERLNPVTNKCEPICPPGETWDPATGLCEVPPEDCDPGYVRDPETGECLPECESGYVWNKERSVCEPECEPGYVYNPDTEQCEEPLPDPQPASTITIKYSFAQEECELISYSNLLRTEDISLPWEFVHGKITEEEFKEQIDGAFAFWKKVFEDEFPWLTINFVRLGDEPGTLPEDGGAEGYHWVDTDDNNVGDIRFFIADLRREGGFSPLATASMTRFGVEPMAADPHKGTYNKDIRFDPRHGWRLDGLDYRGDDTPVEGASISSEDIVGYDVTAASGVPFCGFCGCGEEGHGVHSGGGEDHSAHGEHQPYGHSIMLVAAHELGHVFGLQHTGGQGTGPRPDGPELPHDLTSIMNSGISSSVNLLSSGTVPATINPDGTVTLGGSVPGLGVSGLDEISQVLFDALYKADTVNECIGFVEGWPTDPVAPSPGRWPGYGLRDICEVTVDPSPGDPVFDPENPPSEGLPAPAGIADQGPLELAQKAEKTKSPAHLLGTVYYSEDRRYNSASTQGLYDIHDSLSRSWDFFCPGGPSCRSTLTAWGEEVLYVLSPENEIQRDGDELNGRPVAAVQKVNLVGGDGPIAEWWAWEGDFGKISPFTSGASFKRENLQLPFHMKKRKPTDGMVPLGLHRPCGKGWDTSTNPEWGKELPNPLKINPRGELLNGPGKDTSKFEFQFDCGYGDNGLGFIVDLTDSDVAIARSSVTDGVRTFYAGPEDNIKSLASGGASASGAKSFSVGDDVMKWSWETEEVVTDVDFFSSEGAPSKVIPQMVARNDWPKAAGGYTTVTTTAETATATLIVPAFFSPDLAKSLFPDVTYDENFPYGSLILESEATVAITGPSGDPENPGKGTGSLVPDFPGAPSGYGWYWGDGGGNFTHYSEHVPIWPPRWTTVQSWNGATMGDCVDYDTFTEVGQKIIDWLNDRKQENGEWDGKSQWGDGANSELVLFDPEIIGRTLISGNVGDGERAYDAFYPLKSPETIEGQNIWPTCDGYDGEIEDRHWSWGGLRDSTKNETGGKDRLDWTNGYQFKGAPDGITGMIGYWKIEREVGLLKHVQKTFVSAGEISSSGFPSVPPDGKELSTINFYTKPAGVDIENVNPITGEDDYEDFPWRELVDFSGVTDPAWGYHRPTYVAVGGKPTLGIGPDAEPTGLPQRSKISYYNRTKSNDVCYVEVESMTEGVDPPKYFSVAKFPEDHKAGDGEFVFPASYAEGASVGGVPEADIGTEYWSIKEDYVDTPDMCFVARKVDSDAATPFSEDHCNLYGTVDLNTYERWSAGGGWLLPFEGEKDEALAAGPDVTGAVETKAVGLYKRQQLLINGTVVFDTMEHLEGSSFKQTVLNTKADGCTPITNWVIGENGIMAGNTVYVPKRGYPRTDLLDIEVLTGDAIAILTQETDMGGNGRKSYTSLKLSVLNSGGSVRWSANAAGSGGAGGVGGAKIVTSSDRWVHVIGFPMYVVPATNEAIGEWRTRHSPVALNWLFDLDSGAAKPVVPARIDEGAEIKLIGQSHNTDNASWASLWEHLGDKGGDANFDAPRKSKTIDDNSKVPGTDVMHPAEFF